MAREEEIINSAKEHEKQTFFCDLVKSNLAKGVNSAYGIGFIEGAVWADKTMVDKACEWLEEHVRDYKYYDADFADGNIDVDDLIYGFKKAMEEYNRK